MRKRKNAETLSGSEGGRSRGKETELVFLRTSYVFTLAASLDDPPP